MSLLLRGLRHARRAVLAPPPPAARFAPAPGARWLSDAAPAATYVDHDDPLGPAEEALERGVAGGKFAVVRLGGTQYKVARDDVIVAEHLKHAVVGEDLVLDEVLLVGTEATTVVGRPLVPDARVVCAVEEQTKDAKVVVFKKRRRKASRRRTGHRRLVTLLRVLDIEGDVAGPAEA